MSNQNHNVTLYDAHGSVLETRADDDTAGRWILDGFGRDYTAPAEGSGTAPFNKNVWIYSVQTQIGNALAELPHKYVRKGTNTEVKSAKSEMLLESPNPLMDFERFVEQWAIVFMSMGNVWVLKDQLNSQNMPRALYLFGSDVVSPVRKNANHPPVGWEVRLDGKKIYYDLDEMIHWAMPNPYDMWMGIPPHVSMQAELDADYARNLFDKYFYKNNATPDAVLTYKDGRLNRQQREQIYEAWAEYHQGPERHGGIAVIGGDFDLKVLGISHSDAQFIGAKTLTRQAVATAYWGFPVSLLNSQESSALTKNEIEQARRIKYENCVLPLAKRFAAKITRSLVQVIDPNVVFKFDPTLLPVMIDALKDRVDMHEKLVKSGVPVNESLKRLDLGIDPVEDGDIALVPQTLVELGTDPADLLPQPSKDASKEDDAEGDATEDDNEESGRLLSTPMGRAIKRAIFDIRNSGYSDKNSNFDKSRERVLNKMIPELRSVLTRGIGPKDNKKTQIDELIIQISCATLAYLDKLHSNIVEYGIGDTFKDVHGLAVRVVKQIMQSAVNSNIYMTSGSTKLIESNCSLNHVGERYPGDPDFIFLNPACDCRILA